MATTLTSTSIHRTPRPLAVATATANTVLVWTLAVPAAGTDLVVHAGGGSRAIDATDVVLAAVVSGLAGWGLLAMLERSRHIRHPWRVWRAIALITLALSLISPLVSAATPPAAVTLVALHLATGLTLTALLRPDRAKC